MASLTQTAIIARKVIRYSIYGIIFIIFTRITIGLGVKIYRYLFPKPPPPPTVTFGKLPNLPFPEQTVTIENLVFSLETAEGDLPSFPNQLGVYFMPKILPSIQAKELAQQKAVSLGFKPEGRELVETVFLFENREAPSSLTMNIISEIFSISYDLRANPRVLENVPPTSESAISQVRSYLARSGFLKDDLSGPVTHTYIKIEEGRFVPAISRSEADIIKINIFRKAFYELPAVTPEPDEANVWFMLSGARDRADQIIAAEYHYYPIDEEQLGTYPIKTAQQAWENLKEGKGFIARLGDNKEGLITIRRAYLAYYDAGQYTEFYQPVFVFEGDNGFIAYVPAVTDEYYGK